MASAPLAGGISREGFCFVSYLLPGFSIPPQTDTSTILHNIPNMFWGVHFRFQSQNAQRKKLTVRGGGGREEDGREKKIGEAAPLGRWSNQVRLWPA